MTFAESPTHWLGTENDYIEAAFFFLDESHIQLNVPSSTFKLPTIAVSTRTAETISWLID